MMIKPLLSLLPFFAPQPPILIIMLRRKRGAPRATFFDGAPQHSLPWRLRLCRRRRRLIGKHPTPSFLLLQRLFSRRRRTHFKKF